MHIENVNQLKEIFGIDKISHKYEEYIELIDRNVGFSVKRKYPDNISYLPPKKQNGDPDTVALIYVVYDLPKGTDEGGLPKRVPIYLNITKHSKYLQNHWDYNYEDEECPTKNSIQMGKRRAAPIALESLDEYVYDHETDTLRDSQNNVLSGEDILDNFFQEHCNTVHWFKGLSLRWKLGATNKTVKICDVMVQALSVILKIVFGRTLEPKDPFSGTLKLYEKEDMKLLETESINIFGYKGSKNIIITFCALVVAGYTIIKIFAIQNKFITDIASNNLLTICIAICLMGILDHLLPRLVLHTINCFIRLKLTMVFKKFKT